MNLYGFSDDYVVSDSYEAHLKAGWPRNTYPGTDFAKPGGSPAGLGDPIYCVAPNADVGTIEGDPYLGNITIVSFNYKGDRWDFYYCHAKDCYTQNGIYAHNVSRGTIIGRVGQSGNATGVHTHLTPKKNGIIVNPESAEVVAMLQDLAKPIIVDHGLPAVEPIIVPAVISKPAALPKTDLSLNKIPVDEKTVGEHVAAGISYSGPSAAFASALTVVLYYAAGKTWDIELTMAVGTILTVVVNSVLIIIKKKLG